MATQIDYGFPSYEGIDTTSNQNVATPQNVARPQIDYGFPTYDEPKKSGIFAWGKKGWADMLDYVAITAQTPAAFGAGDFDEALVAESIADINRRAREYIKSEGH